MQYCISFIVACSSRFYEVYIFLGLLVEDVFQRFSLIRQVWNEFEPVPTPAEAALHRSQINGGGRGGGGGGQQTVEARVPLYQLLSSLH
jgi:hypothetical protein